MRRLVPLEGVAADLQYRAEGLPGVTELAFMESEAAERLAEAQQWLDRLREGWELLIWDPWRSRTTQRAIADRYLSLIHI